MAATKLHAGVLAIFVVLARHHVLAQNDQTDVNSSYVDPIFHTQDCWTPPGIPLGCWFDNMHGHRLLGNLSHADPVSMSIELCAEICSTNDYELFGVGYGQECYCGQDITPSAGFPVSDILYCDLTCPGNSTEICGGHNAIILYQTQPLPPPLPPGMINNYTYSPTGCYAEPTDGTRALPDFIFAISSQSSESCSATCGYSNYPFFGLEYGDECWCGTALSSNATLVPTSQCDMPCSGRPSETCGGRGFLNVYQGTLINNSVPTKHRPYDHALRKDGQARVSMA